MTRLSMLLLLLPAWAGAQIVEGRHFRIDVPTVVWYGKGAKFLTVQLPAGTHRCGNHLAGDPADGIVKECRSTAFEQDVQCYPAQLGGTGSRAAWGVSLSPVQAWAGWWCGQSVQIVACTGSGCLPDVFKRVAATTSNTINAELRGARTEHIDSDKLKAVWGPHWAEINAARLQE